jgi:cytochrome c oxidase subunit IV
MAHDSKDVHDGAPGAPAEHQHAHDHHPGWKTYVVVGLILTIITAVEVSAYYIPAWENSKIYVPSMLIMSAVKFVIVVMFYMHLKYDHRLFRALFTGPFIIAATTLLGLMFLFGKLAIRLGILT